MDPAHSFAVNGQEADLNGQCPSAMLGPTSPSGPWMGPQVHE